MDAQQEKYDKELESNITEQQKENIQKDKKGKNHKKQQRAHVYTC